MTTNYGIDDLDTAAAQINQLLSAAGTAVAFTGAGISTESGIPDFRSPDGIWAKNRTVYFNEFIASEEDRREYWRQKSSIAKEFEVARPNVTHEVLARLESDGVLRGVITQNIEGLHQEAGSRNVLELHGTAREVACLSCDWRDSATPWNRRFIETQLVPRCPDCGGLIKHATVSFGQTLPADVLQTSADWAAESSLFLTLGSSLVVEPAASLPRLAVQSGASLVIVNRDPTPLDPLATIVVNAPLGELFRRLLPALHDVDASANGDDDHRVE